MQITLTLNCIKVTEVAGEIFLHFFLTGVRILAEEGQRVHDKARVAEATLLCTLIRDKAAELRGFFLQAFQ